MLWSLLTLVTFICPLEPVVAWQTSTVPPTLLDPDVPAPPSAVYIPYEKLRDVFEREGRGVFLPYEQFQKLWQEANAHRKERPSDKPPVDSLLIAADNVASIEREVIVVKSELTVELFGRGWRRIALRLSDAAVQSAQMEGQPARVLFDANEGYSLLIHHKEESSQKKIELTYAKAYQKSPGQNSVSIQAPQAPLNQWRIKVPDAGIKVQVEPMLAASQVDKSSDSATPNSEHSEILAFVGAVPEVRIRWVPKSEGAIGMTALSSVQSQSRVIIDEGIVRTSTQLAYSIERAELSSLTIQIPSNQKVINVFDPNVRKWSVQANDASPLGSQTLTVELFELARQSQNLVIESESTLENADEPTIRLLPVQCVDANRQQGFIAVRIASGLRAESVDRKGLMQLDASELPPAMQSESWTFAYRYNSLPFETTFRVTKVLPSIRVKQHTEIVIDPDAIHLDVMAVHHVENAGVFQLEFEIPDTYELLQVVGQSMPNVEAAAVDTFRVSEGANRKLQVSLSKRALGPIGLSLQLRRKIEDPNLITPTGSSSRLSLALPRPIGVRWFEGLISIHAPESLRVNPVDKVGVRDQVSPEWRTQFPSTCAQRHPDALEAFVFSHAMEPVTLAVEVERKRPYATARQLTQARVEPGFIQFHATFFIKVQYSSIPAIRIDVPESLSKEIRVETPGVRERPIAPTPDDVEPGYVAWELMSDGPWLGDSMLVLAWKQKLEGLDIGKQVMFQIPRLIPRRLDQAWGQIVLNRKESLDLKSADGTHGLRPIDPRYDLMPGVKQPDAARAYEHQGDWAFNGMVTRYALEKVKQTVIERAFVRAVVTRSNRIGVHAMYRLKNAQQRLAIALPENTEFDSQPLLINGQNYSLERGDANQLFVPLAGFDATQSLIVELKYTLAGNHEQIDLPVFPDSSAVQSAYLGVFLPKEQVLIASKGPWTEEFELQHADGWRSRPVNARSPYELEAWVQEGLATQPKNATVTPSDGVFYLYSTMRPENPPAGSLRLVAIADPWWTVSVLSVFVLIGLVLLPASFTTKVIAIATVASTMVLTGVVTPTFASQLANIPSYLGIALIGLIWCAHGVIQWGRRFHGAGTNKQQTAAPLESQSASNGEPDQDDGPTESATAAQATPSEPRGDLGND
jgi:hypothetical protein